MLKQLNHKPKEKGRNNQMQTLIQELIQESTFNVKDPLLKNIITIEAGTVFYNAPRTSNDRIKIINADGTETSYRGGMLSFWTESTGIETRDLGFLCANENCPYGNNIEAYDLVGGHIVGEKPKKDKIEDGDRFCILPLCPKCNSSHNKGAMKLRYRVKSPVLTWREHRHIKNEA